MWITKHNVPDETVWSVKQDGLVFIINDKYRCSGAVLDLWLGNAA